MTATGTSLVRLATVADAPAIARIQIDGWRATYRGVVPDAILDGFEHSQRAARWAEMVDHSPADGTAVWVVCADDDGRGDPTGEPAVVGFAMSGQGRDESAPPPDGAGEIYAIYLDPPVIGRGHGRALFVRTIEDLHARGFDPLVVWVLDANPRARAFYEAAGFRADGARNAIDFDGTLVDEIRYRLDRT
jgi:ribosomal protein S18 acetylase RimI-like enzyme